MNIEDIDRYCDRFEDRLKSGDSISMDSFIKEQQLPADAQLASELRRVQQEYATPRAMYSTVAYQPITPTVSDRYSPLKFHARGGVGEVWLAEDEEIGRQVALKKLSRDEEGSNERFIAEAQITGQLEHPSVVPVHDVGVDKSGKPYYVMKFVHGRTLRDAIEEYHAAEGTSSGHAGEEALALQQQRLLDHFIDICEAVAFAHTRGVVHRDIKPSNVMLGLFGETIVLDWGLAKVLHQPELPGLSTALTSSGRSSETAQGSVLGTPAYMPPEIADGKAADAGPAVDIYLLGATLYEILTGSTPRSGSSHDEIVQLARTVAPVPPREKNPKVARALEAICQKAMAKRDRDRYASALDIAEETRRYLAGAPVSAYPEPLPTRLWRWTKRNRRGLVRGATAAVIVAILFVAVEARAKIARLAAEDQALQEIEQFREAYDNAMFFIGDESEMFFIGDQSDVAAANQKFAMGDEGDVADANQPFTYYDAERGRKAIERALDQAEPWGKELETLILDEEQRSKLRRELYELQLLRAQLSLTFPSPGRPDEASDALARAESFGIETPSLNRLQAGGDTNALSDGIGESAYHFDHFLLGEQLRTQSIAASGGRNAQLKAAIEHYRSALRIKPDHYWSRLQLGRCLLALGEDREAIGTLGGCVALKDNVPWAFTARALALSRQQRFAEALADLNHVLSVDPGFQPARLNRGVIHWRQGNDPQATRDFQSILAVDDRPLILAEYYLGQMSLEQGDLEAALKHFVQFADGNQLRSFRPAHFSLAKTHYLLGQEGPGLEHLNLYLRLSLPESFDQDSADSRYRRGKFIRELTTLELKNLINKVAIQLGAKSPKVRNLATIRGKLRGLALEELEAAAATSKTAAVFLELGTVQRELRNYQAAEAAYNSGLSIDDQSLGLYFQRGQLRFLRSANDLAQQDFTRAAQLEPDIPDEVVLKPSAHSWSGICFALEKKQNHAERQAELAAAELLDVDPTDREFCNVLHNIACVYGGLSELDRENRDQLQEVAFRYLESAIDRAGTNVRVATEIELMQGEDARLFSPQLKAHPKFKTLLQQAIANLGGKVAKP